MEVQEPVKIPALRGLARPASPNAQANQARFAVTASANSVKTHKTALLTAVAEARDPQSAGTEYASLEKILQAVRLTALAGKEAAVAVAVALQPAEMGPAIRATRIFVQKNAGGHARMFTLQYAARMV